MLLSSSELPSSVWRAYLWWCLYHKKIGDAMIGWSIKLGVEKELLKSIIYLSFIIGCWIFCMLLPLSRAFQRRMDGYISWSFHKKIFRYATDGRMIELRVKRTVQVNSFFTLRSSLLIFQCYSPHQKFSNKVWVGYLVDVFIGKKLDTLSIQ